MKQILTDAVDKEDNFLQKLPQILASICMTHWFYILLFFSIFMLRQFLEYFTPLSDTVKNWPLYFVLNKLIMTGFIFVWCGLIVIAGIVIFWATKNFEEFFCEFVGFTLRISTTLLLTYIFPMTLMQAFGDVLYWADQEMSASGFFALSIFCIFAYYSIVIVIDMFARKSLSNMSVTEKMLGKQDTNN